MKSTGVCIGACFLVALNSVEKALGEAPQTLFSEHSRWLWWLIAGVFLLNGLAILKKSARRAQEKRGL